jgi:hypothetical protein
MEETAADKEPDNGSGKGDIPARSPPASGSVAVAPAAAAGAEGIQLPVWTKVLGWCGIAGLIYLLICAVSIISRRFAGLRRLRGQAGIQSGQTQTGPGFVPGQDLLGIAVKGSGLGVKRALP